MHQPSNPCSHMQHNAGHMQPQRNTDAAHAGEMRGRCRQHAGEMRASAGVMRGQRTTRMHAGEAGRQCAGSRGRMRDSSWRVRELPKWLRKKKKWADEGKRNPKEEIRRTHAAAQKFMCKSDFENSYLSIQEESGQVINRRIVAKDLSFKLI